MTDRPARRTLHFVVPGSLDTPTGGYRYDRRVVRGLRTLGRETLVHELDGSFPTPTPAALDAADAALTALPDGALALVDGLAYGAMPAVAERHADRLDLVALVHHPLMHETGLSAEAVERHRAEETRALAAARRIIVTSRATRDGLAELDVDPARVAVVAPGTDAAPVATGSDDGVPALLCVATLTPRKDHATLVEALARVAHRPWRLTCVGSDEADSVTAAALRERVRALGLEDRVSLVGALDEDELAAVRASSDLFVLASRYEGYGMVFDEAMASGLPIVATTGGAIVDTVPADAALLVPAGDVDALANALDAALGDAAVYRCLREGALAARERLRRWDVAVAEFDAALEPDAAPVTRTEERS